MTSRQDAHAEIFSETARHNVQARLEQLSSSIVPDPGAWKATHLSFEELEIIHPLRLEDLKSFVLPSIRRTATASLHTYLSRRHPGLPINDLLFAVDMEIRHIHMKVRKLMWNKKAELATIVAMSSGHDEWRFHQQGTPGIDLRLDDYILFMAAVQCSEGETKIKDEDVVEEDVVELYLAKFAEYRFEDRVLPYPAGVDPKRVDQMYAERALNEQRDQARKVTAALKERRHLTKMMDRARRVQDRLINIAEKNDQSKPDFIKQRRRENTKEFQEAKFEGMNKKEKEVYLRDLVRRFDGADKMNNVANRLVVLTMGEENLDLDYIIEKDEKKAGDVLGTTSSEAMGVE